MLKINHHVHFELKNSAYCRLSLFFALLSPTIRSSSSESQYAVLQRTRKLTRNRSARYSLIGLPAQVCLGNHISRFMSSDAP